MFLRLMQNFFSLLRKIAGTRVSPWLLLAGTAALFAYAFYFSFPDSVFPITFFERKAFLAKITRCFLGTTVWLTLFFAVLSQLRFALRIPLTLCLFVPATFFAYIGWVYGVYFGSKVLALDIAETHWEEARQFIGAAEIALCIACLVSAIFFAWFLGKIHLRIRYRKTALVAMILFLCLMKNSQTALPLRQILDPMSAGLETKKSFNATKKSFNATETDNSILNALLKLESDPQTLARERSRAEKNAPLVFLHLGESVRADHAPFNGYARDTMPRMRKEYEEGRLISFPRCVSFSNGTRFSVLGIMTPAEVLDPVIRGGSFVPALKESGVRTVAFYSSMPPDLLASMHDISLAAICRNFDKTKTTRRTSDALVPAITAQISKAKAPEFFLYYGEGSHVPFKNYDKIKFSRFGNAGDSKFDACVADYDNTIFATDDFCGNVIDALREKDAVYIYVSDHGQEINEKAPFFTRSFRSRDVRHVLFFIWCSESFKREHPEKWRALCENRERLGVVSHDFVYHTVLGLYGVKTPHSKECFDLFSPNAQPFPTEMPEAKGMDSISFEGEKKAIRWVKQKSSS